MLRLNRFGWIGAWEQEEEGLGKRPVSAKAAARKARAAAEAAEAETMAVDDDAELESAMDEDGAADEEDADENADEEDGADDEDAEDDEEQEFEPLEESLADELKGVAKDVNVRLREEQRKLIDSLDLSQYVALCVCVCAQRGVRRID